MNTPHDEQPEPSKLPKSLPGDPVPQGNTPEPHAGPLYGIPAPQPGPVAPALGSAQLDDSRLAADELRDYQHLALEGITERFKRNDNRVTLVLPCGTGKTRIAGELLRKSKPLRVVVLVPTIELLAQIADDLRACDPGRRLMRVCSKNLGDGDESREAHTLGLSVTAQIPKIAAALRSPQPILVVATYASAHAVNQAAAAAGITFDLAIADEAHRTAGHVNKAWGLVVRDEFRAKRRLFMTATPRIVTIPERDLDTADDVALSMDRAAYGPRLRPLKFRRAIDEGWLSNYQVLTIGVRASAARRLVRLIDAGDKYTALDAAAHLALAQIHTRYPHLRTLLAFHNLVDRSRLWSERLQAVFRALAAQNPGELTEAPVVTFHVDAETPIEDRKVAIEWLKNPRDEIVVGSNCGIYTEGVNIPALDAVMFAAPRSSTPDIVQIVGRAMRVLRDKDDRPVHNHPALVIIPVLIEDSSDDVDNALTRSSHRAAWQILQSLAIEDEQLQTAIADWSIDVPRGIPFRSPILSVDLPSGLTTEARNFFIRHIEESVPSLGRVLAWVRRFYAETGGVDFPEGLWEPSSDELDADNRPKGFMFAPAVQRVRRRYAAKTLPRHLVRAFEDVPGWSWEDQPKSAKPRSKMPDAIEYGVAIGLITNDFLPRDQPVTMDGVTYNVSNWFYGRGKGQMRGGKLLDPDVRARLMKVIPKNFPNDTAA